MKLQRTDKKAPFFVSTSSKEMEYSSSQLFSLYASLKISVCSSWLIVDFITNPFEICQISKNRYQRIIIQQAIIERRAGDRTKSPISFSETGLHSTPYCVFLSPPGL
jgi:hypothetical protein